MSSILDALERAARDRGQGKSDIPPPTITPVGETQFHLRRLLLWGVAVIGVVAASWLLFTNPVYQPRSGPAEKGPPVRSAVQPESASTPESHRGRAPMPQSRPVQSRDVSIGERIRKSGQPNQRPLVSEAVLSEGRRSETLPVKPRPEVATDGQARDRGRVEEVARPAPYPSGESTAAALPLPGDVAGVNKLKRLAVSQEAEKAVAPSVLSEPEETVVGDQVERQQIPLIWELDQGLREELEQLQTSIHVYHQVPSQRFVIINMRRYTEGDNLGKSGYRLHAIDRDGIIVDHGNGLVRLLRER